MKMKKFGNRLGEAAVLLAAVFWGCIGIFARDLTARGFSSVQTVAGRAILTALTMFLAILVFKPSLLRVRLRDLWMFAGTGLCSFLFFNICYMSSISENSLSVACILMYTSPFWVIALSVPVFHEKVTWQKVVSLLIAFGGCVLVCTSSTLVLTGRGLVFGLLSGFGYALYSIFGKLAVKYHAMTVILYTFLFAAAGALPFCDLPRFFGLLAAPGNLLPIVGISIVNTVIPYILYTYGLSVISSGKAAVLSIIEPVVAALVGSAVFGESMGLSGMIGMVLVAAGLILMEVRIKTRT